MSSLPGRPDRGFEREFLAEAETLLEEAIGCVDALEGAGDDPNPAKVNALFRAVHSLKGVAAMVGQAGISEGAHDLEAVLDGVRMGRVALTPPVHAAVRDGVLALSSLVGRVAAGVPIEPLEQNDVISVPEELIGRGENYVLRVKGTSMVLEGILDGDYIVVQARNQADNGDMVVALVRGEATVKRFYRERGGMIRLQPANDSLSPILARASDVEIRGVVTAVMRKFQTQRRRSAA